MNKVMTKKIFSLLLVSFATCAVMAQLPQRVEGNPDQRNDELMRFAPMEKQSAAPAGELQDNISRLMERNPLVDELSKVSLSEVAFPVYKTPSANDETKAFYWKPAGTYFIGIDHGLGNTFQGIVGTWLDKDIKAWTFQGGSTNYKDISFQTYFSGMMPDAYYTDKNAGTWNDTLVAQMRGSEVSFISYDMPYLMVANGNVRDTFTLCADSKDYSLIKRQEAIGKIGVAATMAGAPYTGHANYDYTWPMTNALTLDCELGNLVQNVYSVEPLEYFIGTTDVTVEGNAITPDGFVTAYEKPQTELYVRDITLWLEASQVNEGKATYKDPVMGEKDTLWLVVETEAGAEIVKSFATKENLMLKANKGAILTFDFITKSTEYGEILSRGFVVNEPFKVRVTGLSKCTGDFKIVTALAPYGSNTSVLVKDEAEPVKYAEFEPYLMLNGIFPTLFDAYVNVEDTLQVIDMEMGDGSTRNVAAFDETQTAAGYVPALYSYFYPVDTLKQVTNITFQGPEWITWGYDDTDWAGETYSDMIYLYFFAEELPEGVTFREGNITLSSFGKSKTYYVYQGVKPEGQQIGDGTTDLEESNVQPVKVYSLNGQFNLTYPNVYTAVEVYAVNGNKVASYNLPENGSFSIDNSSLANGVYLIHMIGQTSEVLKVVK